MTVARLRRGALICAIVGVVLAVVSATSPGEPDMSTNDNLWMWFVWSLGLLVGCGALVLAGNGLAWSAILPRLTRSQPWRNVTVTVLVVIFALLSVALTFGLVLAAILTYQYWGPLVPWRQ